MSNKKRICANEECEKEYTLTPNKPGMVNVCFKCGYEQEEGQVNSGKVQRLGGVMHYGHKTAGEIIIMPMNEAQQIIKAGERNTGHVLTRIVRNKI